MKVFLHKVCSFWGGRPRYLHDKYWLTAVIGPDLNCKYMSCLDTPRHECHLHYHLLLKISRTFHWIPAQYLYLRTAGLIVLFWRHCASPDLGGEERCWACCCNKSSWYRGLGPLFGGKHSLCTTHLGLHKFSLFRLQKYTFLLLCWGHIYCQWSSWLNKCYDICNITLSGTVWLEMKK